MPFFSYAFGGLHIQSDFCLPGLSQLTGGGIGNPPDIRIILAQGTPPSADPVYSWPGRFGLQLAIAGNRNLFLSARYGSFLVNSRADTIQCFPNANAEAVHASEGMRQVLMRRVLPRVTQLHGRTCFHGASVMLTSRAAVLLLGPSHTGKSTLAAALNHELGWHVLSDDISIIDGAVIPPLCFPVVSGACLWPDSVASFASPSMKSHSLPAHDEKRWCELKGEAPGNPSTVQAMLFIEPKGGDHQEIRLRRLTLTAAVMSAMRQLVRFNPADVSAIKRHMDSLGALMQHIPAYSLSYSRSYETLPKVADFLRSYFESGSEQLLKTC